MMASLPGPERLREGLVTITSSPGSGDYKKSELGEGKHDGINNNKKR